ncbi:MAG: hypothetical protein ACJATN_002384 [Neolewinella sp.]|jgi:hypothetical protein
MPLGYSTAPAPLKAKRHRSEASKKQSVKEAKRLKSKASKKQSV